MNPERNNYYSVPGTTTDWQLEKAYNLRTKDRVKILTSNGDEHIITVMEIEAKDGTDGIVIDGYGHRYHEHMIGTLWLDPASRPKLPVETGRMIKNVKTIGRFEFDYGIRIAGPASRYQWRLFNTDSLYGEQYSDDQILEFTTNG